MKQECQCCGTCCRNGGPPLHGEDLPLVESGILSFEDLVTIRSGELVVPPMATRPVIAQTEWIKVQGQGTQWCCRFLDIDTNKCTIYENRPVSCRALKCWDTEVIIAMAGQNLLGRLDLISPEDPLLPLVQFQEKQIPLPNLEGISDTLKNREKQQEVLGYLTAMVQDDLYLRTKAVSEFNLTLATELFYFGRPLFQLLLPLDIVTTETPHGITLQLHTS